MSYQLDEWLMLRQQLEHDEISIMECFDRCIELNHGKHANSPWNSKEWKTKRKMLIGNNTCCQKCGIDTSQFRQPRFRHLVLQHPPGEKHQLFLVGECETKEEFLDYIDSIISYRSLETVSMMCNKCSFGEDASSPILAQRKKDRTSKKRKYRKKYQPEKKDKNSFSLAEYF